MPEPEIGRVGDRGIGPAPTPGVPVELAEGITRLTAPNPSMMTGPGTNSYLIGREELIVIDPGPRSAEHLAALMAAIDGRPVNAVAVTHTHPDHAPGADALATRLAAPTAGISDGPSFVAELRLGDGDRLRAGDLELEVIATPGHAASHCCFLLAAQGLCFTGDHVMEGSTVVIRRPDGDMAAYLSSLERLARWEPGLRQLAPGHGRLIGDPVGAIEELIDHRLRREQHVLEQLRRRGPSTTPELLELSYPGLEERRREVASATLEAHLEHLVELGQAERSSVGEQAPHYRASPI